MIRQIYFIFLLLIFIGCGNNTSRVPGIHFELEDPELQIQLVASESVINTPIAMEIDEKGRLWVLEMPDYMPDIDGVNEDIPKGRIVILTDRDKDGYMEHGNVFLDSLHQPRAMLLAYGGLLYAESPNLWFVPIIDDQPGQRELIDSTYSLGGNVEHQPNGLLLNIDNWIYNAKSNYRYRKQEGKWFKESTTYRGQWGITHDKWGRLLYNDNSNGLYADAVLPNTISQFRWNLNPSGLVLNALKDRSIFPAHSTAVNRGYLPNVLDDEQMVQEMTSACGPLVYSGNSLPDHYNHSAFICIPEGNLIKRVTLNEDSADITATNVYPDTEWIRSKDEGFRPVNLYHGHDGNIYVVDMHRGIIQHKTYMTNYLRDLILERQLDTIFGMGRILKISSKDDRQEEVRDLGLLSDEELINLFNHPNIWKRKKAQQLLIKRNPISAAELSIQFLQSSTQIGKIHTLYFLEGVNKLNELAFLVHLDEKTPWSNSHALIVYSKSKQSSSQDQLMKMIEEVAAYDDPISNPYVAFALGGITQTDFSIRKKDLYVQLIKRNPESRIICEMILAGSPNQASSLFDILQEHGSDFQKIRILEIRENYNNNVQNSIFQEALPYLDDKTNGRKLFNIHCTSCHGKNGLGITNLGPSLKGGKIVNLGGRYIAHTILRGLKGPVSINNQLENFASEMPGLADFKSISDSDIADISNYIENAFRSNPDNITGEDVKILRNKTQHSKEIPSEAYILQFNQN